MKINANYLKFGYNSLRTEGYKNEKRDCGVVALSIACEVPYNVAHDALKKRGRRDRGSTNFYDLLKAIKDLGYDYREWEWDDFQNVINQYPNPHCNMRSITPSHPKRFPKAWGKYKNKSLIALTRNHFFTIHNGKVIDWSEGRAFRVCRMIEILTDD